MLWSDGVLTQEDVDATVFRDRGGESPVDYDMQIDTGWYKLDGIAGLVRAYEVQLVGEFYDQHSVDVTVDYDYKTSGGDTHGFDDLTSMEPYILGLDVRSQKAAAVKLSIREQVPTTSTTYKAFGLNALRIIFGRTKRRARPLRAEVRR